MVLCLGHADELCGGGGTDSDVDKKTWAAGPLRGDWVLRKDFEREKDLVKAALKEFTEKGYEQASINKIIQESGMSKGTFYYHFLGKEELFFYLVEKVAAMKVEWLSTHTPKEATGPIDLFSLLRMHLRMMVGFIEEYPDYADFGFSLIQNASSDLYQKIMDRMEPQLTDYLLPLIEREYNAGHFASSFSKDFVVQIVIFLFRNSYAILKDRLDEGIDRIVDMEDQLFTFIERGLKR